MKTTDVTIAVNGNKWVVCFLAKYEIPLPLNFFIILFIKRLRFTYFVASNAFCNLFIATLTVLFHSLVCKVWNLHSLFRKCKRYLQTNWTLHVFIYLFLFKSNFTQMFFVIYSDTKRNVFTNKILQFPSNQFGIIHWTFVYYFTLINMYCHKKGKKRRQNKTRLIDQMTRVAQNPTTWRISLTARRIVRATLECVRECPCVWRTLPTLGARGHCQEQAQTSSCRDKLTSR